MTAEPAFLYDDSSSLDPLGDAEKESEQGIKRNFAKVGSGRPSSLLYTYGPGAVMDLPQFTIMPAGLDDWDRIWARRDGIPTIHAPRLRDVVRLMLKSPNAQLRPFPWQPKKISMSTDGDDLGVPARVFPQWVRCTGCDMLGPISKFGYRNTHPFRTDEACFEHIKCFGRPGRGNPQDAATPCRSGPVPARLHRRAPRRISLRPVGAPRTTLREGRVPRAENGRQNLREGRVRDHRVRLLRTTARHERGAGRGRPREAAALPRPAPTPGCL